MLSQSHPLLAAAAEDAVRTWEYTETLLNGEPVPVSMLVTVNFHAGGAGRRSDPFSAEH